MHLLMVIAMVGAITIGQWFEGATVAFLFSLALLLEHWSVGRARRAVAALMDLSPTIANVIGEGERGVEEVEVGARTAGVPQRESPSPVVETTRMRGLSASFRLWTTLRCAVTTLKRKFFHFMLEEYKDKRAPLQAKP